jgi:membrane fusion protein (multidrug efflux system)
VAEARPVELGPLQGDSWLIAGGLVAGERVIVDGQQKVQPGQPVRVTAGEAGTGGRTAAGDASSVAPEAGDPESDPGAAAER